ncbi:MAG TPA: GTP-binding protein [Vicinamibacterales bacterium]|nr:GTP-binding protein [Vicinamibacterales bacterium]
MTDSHQLNLVVVGHVDHGKSTLIGRIFYDTGSLPEGKYEQLVGIAQRRGVPFEFANLMDGLQAERDQNITIDTAQIWFRTKQREYVIIDAPGHKEFVKNMVTGASRADAALIIIDALEGVQEQTRRHGYLLRLIGVRQVVVVVNKMDLVGYSQATFDKVSTDYRKFLAGIGVEARRILPVSAREGDNIAARGENLKWFDGPTVVQALDEIPDAAEITNQPLRFPIQDVYRFDHRRILAGRIEAGTLKVGDQLLFLPTGRTSVVRSIESWNTPHVDELKAGQPAGVTLADQLFVERGSMAVHADDAPSLATEFTARVFWLGRTPLAAGRRYKLKLVTQEVECEIKTLEEVVDASTVETIKGADSVRTNDAARVVIRTRRPVAVDLFERIPTLGRLVLVDGFDVAGGGIVIEIPERFAAANVVGDAGLSADLAHVARGERHLRHGHRGAVVWLTGVPGSGKTTLAKALERQLFEQHIQVFVLDGQNIRPGLSADLGVSGSDREENMRRVAEVAKLFAESGAVCIVAFTSPTRAERDRARSILETDDGPRIPFLEAYLSSTNDVSSQYEPPEHPEVTLTESAQLDDRVNRVLEHLMRQIR